MLSTLFSSPQGSWVSCPGGENSLPGFLLVLGQACLQCSVLKNPERGWKGRLKINAWSGCPARTGESD